MILNKIWLASYNSFDLFVNLNASNLIALLYSLYISYYINGHRHMIQYSQAYKEETRTLPIIVFFHNNLHVVRDVQIVE